MKFVIALAVCAAVVLVGQAAPQSNVDGQWNDFKVKHHKSYSGDEEAKRKAIFADNVRKIEEHNKKYAKGEVTYTQGINEFTDLTPEEFSQHHHGVVLPTSQH